MKEEAAADPVASTVEKRVTDLTSAPDLVNVSYKFYVYRRILRRLTTFLEDGVKGPQMYIPKEVTEDELLATERIHTGINFQNYDQIDVQVTGSGKGCLAIQ